AWPIWMVARSSTLSSVYDIGAAPYRKGQVLHSVFAAAKVRRRNFQFSVIVLFPGWFFDFHQSAYFLFRDD
ncbi:hypothetical protein ACRCQ0_09125, partial [Pseudomonas aeruginosa]